MKNDVTITGTLHSVDQYLNIKLKDVSVSNNEEFPYLGCCRDVYIRGSSVRHIVLPNEAINVELLQDATRKELLEVSS